MANETNIVTKHCEIIRRRVGGDHMHMTVRITNGDN